MNVYKQEEIATLKAKTSGLNIFLKWIWMNSTVPKYVKETMVFYLQEGDSKLTLLQRYKNSSKTECMIKDVMVDANYNICIKVIMDGNWPGIREPTICTRVTNNKWEISALIGSTTGAFLALFLIILLVLMSKRVKKRQRNIKNNINQFPQRQRYDSAFESQFDSVAIREDTSFYDELITSEVSYFDGSYKLSTDNNLSSSLLLPILNTCENTSSKSSKKRTSLIKEESSGSQSCDGWMYTIITKQNDKTYLNGKELRNLDYSPSRLINENKAHTMETCIDEIEMINITNNEILDSTDESSTMDLNPCSHNKNAISSNLVTEFVENL